MKTIIKNKRITGILGILPETEYDFDEETKEFANAKTRRLKSVMGLGKRRAAKGDTTTHALCEYGLQYLFDERHLCKEEIGALIVVGASPDRPLPPISNMIQGDLGLSTDIFCMDITQGCAAHLLGLLQAFLLLNIIGNKKALVFTGSVLRRKEKETPVNSPSFDGDAASITIVENDASAKDIFLNFHMEGNQSGEVQADGSTLFNFVQKEVPALVEEAISMTGLNKNDIDYFLFHQPHKFMLQKLAERLNVPYDRLPMNIVENFGTSSSCLPLNISYNLGEKLLDDSYLCCLAGFGIGLTCAAAVMNLGNLDFCEIVISDL